MKAACRRRIAVEAAKRNCTVEPLEQRSLLSVDFSGGILSVTGTDGSDHVEVGGDATDLWVKLNGEVRTFNSAWVQWLRIDSGNGKDWVTVDDQVLLDTWISGGKGRDHLDGGGGNDQLYGDNGQDYLEGGSGDDELHGGSGKDFLDGSGGENLLDGDAGNDTELNGLSIDPDVELLAQLRSTRGASGHAKFMMEQADQGLNVELQMEIQDAIPNSLLDVLIDGFLLGQIATDGSGSGELNSSSHPDAGRAASPTIAFSQVASGSLLNVGNVLEGTLRDSIKFSVDTWDVSVGETLHLGTIIRSGSLNGVTLSGNARFIWPFQTGQPVTITPEMLESGDHGSGEYGIFALDHSGATLDHFTIRIR